MEPERLALYTTVYPGVERYLPDWYRSVQAQTDKNFDLWIGVDSLTEDQVIEAIGQDPRARWFKAHDDVTPAAIRQGAIEEIIQSYPAVVFVDSDDLLEPSRVEAARNDLRTWDVSACALHIIDESGRKLGATFGLLEVDDLRALLPRYNVFGLSNTAYRSDMLRGCLPLPDGCDLIDWQLATRAWLLGAKLHFDSIPRMSYRQYSANIARVIPPYTPEYVLLATRRVLGHYRDLLEGGSLFPDRSNGMLDAARSRAEEFERSIAHSPRILGSYVDALNRLRPRYVWWWCVAHPDLENLWKN